jgi:hypothetical protein
VSGFTGILPPRSVEDILAERIRLVIGGETYDLPVLPIRENRAWKERMDLELGWLVAKVSSDADASVILRLFDGSEALFMDLLQSYDTSGVLPPREVIEAGLTPLGLIRAVLEVWRAARPLADITAAVMTPEVPRNGWRQRMSSWLRRMAGATGTSSAS